MQLIGGIAVHVHHDGLGDPRGQRGVGRCDDPALDTDVDRQRRGGVPDSVVGSLEVPQPPQSKTAAVIVARALIILGSS